MGLSRSSNSSGASTHLAAAAGSNNSSGSSNNNQQSALADGIDYRFTCLSLLILLLGLRYGGCNTGNMSNAGMGWQAMQAATLAIRVCMQLGSDK